MTEVIKKVAIDGEMYSIGGGSTSIEVKHKVVTQEEFDNIPQEEKVKNVYMIKGEAEPTPTPGESTIIVKCGEIFGEVEDVDTQMIADAILAGKQVVIHRYRLYDNNNGRFAYEAYHLKSFGPDSVMFANIGPSDIGSGAYPESGYIYYLTFPYNFETGVAGEMARDYFYFEWH